jgi:hypothetical protein
LETAATDGSNEQQWELCLTVQHFRHFLILSFHREIKSFLVFGFLRDVRDEFTDDVSEHPVGPIFTGQPTHLVILVHLTSDYGTQREFRNVVGKLASHMAQKPQN